ncbi:MAG: hypothetical protein K8S13_11275 [Desulfobacula sp.]|uniref:hypothetical protein n=1 Tax=Desulfobacula sp. TaxID=2593537 RepID=UPI0025C0A202|nr:hypothetical protein [Desulfobacula sp.]MCD4720422.1 hypothetical protein [Desulfobacula sp.]
MTEWVDDPWIGFGCEMAEEFFSNHRETIPEDPHNVWDENEIGYFCFAFALWAAQSKFKLKKGTVFNDRALQYCANVESAMNDSEQIEGDDSEKSNCDVYKIREQEYVSLLMKGSGSLFGAITGSPFKRACKSFVSHACKRYIFSERDLVKIIHPWLVEKGMEFDKKIDFT